MIFAVFAPSIVHAANPATLDSLTKTTTQMKVSIDTTWVLISGFLVFFMQCGFTSAFAFFDVRHTEHIRFFACAS
jgi:ammonium transporter, Amt family